MPSNNTLTVNGTLANHAGINGLVVKSDVSGTGSLIHSTANVNAKVERYLSDGMWHFVGMPVSSAMAGVFHLPSGHSDIYLRTHNEATNTWGAYIVPVTTLLALGRGYETWVGDPAGFSQPETVAFTGILNTGNYTTGSGGFYGLQYTSGHGLNLISNPYPCALQANINTWSKNNIANSVWTWSDAFGNYVYWGSGNDYGGGNFGTMTGGVIPAMQAFFVEATASSPWLTIPQSDRIHSSQPYYKDFTLANTLRLDVEGNDYKDAIFVGFNGSATDDFDAGFDVKKMFGLDEAPQFYSYVAEDKLSINSLPEFEDYRLVSLGFECAIPSVFTITASELESFEEYMVIYLEDLKEGTLHNLSNDVTYTFYHEVGDDPGRFLLHFGEPNAIGETNLQNVRIYSNNDVVYIQKPAGMHGDIMVYDMVGREIVRQKTEMESLEQIRINSGTGYYLIRLQTDNNVITEKVFIK
ncbi:MAG: T9SS type A sorting domain-containing protein [Bacteroidales bacterium]